MQFDFNQLDALLDIQKIDLGVIQAKKARAELPQRIEVVKLRKKRDEITVKLEQVMELKTAADAKLTKLEDEDRALEEKQQRAQELIDEAGADYRKVESHSKEMAAAEKRRATLAGEIAAAKAEVDKIDGVREQIQNAIAGAISEEERLRSSFQAQDDELVDKVRELLEKRAQLVSGIDAQLVELYDKTAEKCGGVAVGKLQEGRCGVCRSTIEGGQLIQVRAQAPLATCPLCKRLLIVEDE